MQGVLALGRAAAAALLSQAERLDHPIRKVRGRKISTWGRQCERHAPLPLSVPLDQMEEMALFLLAASIDQTYLDSRIREETVGRYGLTDLLREITDAAQDHS
jgi:hypothetical protein